MNQERKAKISLALKKSKLVRIAVYPFLSRKKEKLKQICHDSEEGAYLRTLRNKYEGKKCFIIGNGPSLTIDDLELLKNEFTFAANKILYLLDKTSWRPTAYLCLDIEAYYMISDELKKYDIPYKFINFELKKANVPKDMHYVYPYSRFSLNKFKTDIGISEDISSFVYSGYTVTFTAIQMAIYMGFQEIYLLGCDHSYAVQIDRKGRITKNEGVQTYAKGIPDWGKSVQNVEVTTAAYQCAKAYCDKHDVKIYNATRGGKLEVFERVDFDILFQKTEVSS